MKFISHRGNLEKKILNEENKPEKILHCLNSGYDIEIDVWMIDNKLFLGHDTPQYSIDKNFILDNFLYLWCHAKNLNALNYMLIYEKINCFCHQNDDYVITSKKNVWTFPNKQLTEKSIAVLPEISNYSLEELKKCYGICSDNIEYYKKILGKI